MIEDVKAFHEKFGLEGNKYPDFLNQPISLMKLNHLLEEFLELANAMGYQLRVEEDKVFIAAHKQLIEQADLELTLDALVDMQYVLLGLVHLMGFSKYINNSKLDGTVWEEAFARVHFANMQKVRGQTKRGSDFDVMKPEGWEPPYLKDLLNG